METSFSSVPSLRNLKKQEADPEINTASLRDVTRYVSFGVDQAFPGTSSATSGSGMIRDLFPKLRSKRDLEVDVAKLLMENSVLKRELEQERTLRRDSQIAIAQVASTNSKLEMLLAEKGILLPKLYEQHPVEMVKEELELPSNQTPSKDAELDTNRSSDVQETRASGRTGFFRRAQDIASIISSKFKINSSQHDKQVSMDVSAKNTVNHEGSRSTSQKNNSHKNQDRCQDKDEKAEDQGTQANRGKSEQNMLQQSIVGLKDKSDNQSHTPVQKGRMELVPKGCATEVCKDLIKKTYQDLQRDVEKEGEWQAPGIFNNEAEKSKMKGHSEKFATGAHNSTLEYKIVNKLQTGEIRIALNGRDADAKKSDIQEPPMRFPGQVSPRLINQDTSEYQMAKIKEIEEAAENEKTGNIIKHPHDQSPNRHERSSSAVIQNTFESEKREVSKPRDRTEDEESKRSSVELPGQDKRPYGSEDQTVSELEKGEMGRIRDTESTKIKNQSTHGRHRSSRAEVDSELSESWKNEIGKTQGSRESEGKISGETVLGKEKNTSRTDSQSAYPPHKEEMGSTHDREARSNKYQHERSSSHRHNRSSRIETQIISESEKGEVRRAPAQSSATDGECKRSNAVVVVPVQSETIRRSQNEIGSKSQSREVGRILDSEARRNTYQQPGEVSPVKAQSGFRVGLQNPLETRDKVARLSPDVDDSILDKKGKIQQFQRRSHVKESKEPGLTAHNPADSTHGTSQKRVVQVAQERLKSDTKRSELCHPSQEIRETAERSKAQQAREDVAEPKRNSKLENLNVFEVSHIQQKTVVAERAPDKSDSEGRHVHMPERSFYGTERSFQKSGQVIETGKRGKEERKGVKCQDQVEHTHQDKASNQNYALKHNIQKAEYSIEGEHRKEKVSADSRYPQGTMRTNPTAKSSESSESRAKNVWDPRNGAQTEYKSYTIGQTPIDFHKQTLQVVGIQRNEINFNNENTRSERQLKDRRVPQVAENFHPELDRGKVRRLDKAEAEPGLATDSLEQLPGVSASRTHRKQVYHYQENSRAAEKTIDVRAESTGSELRTTSRLDELNGDKIHKQCEKSLNVEINKKVQNAPNLPGAEDRRNTFLQMPPGSQSEFQIDQTRQAAENSLKDDRQTEHGQRIRGAVPKKPNRDDQTGHRTFLS